MKKALPFLLLLLTACSTETTTYPADITGLWTLTKVTDYSDDSILQIPEDEILLKFSGETLLITNVSQHPDIPLSAGTHPIQLIENTFGGYDKAFVADIIHTFHYSQTGYHLQLTTGSQHYDLIRPIDN